MWNKDKKRYTSGQQELQVCVKVSELCELNISADNFVDAFKDELKKIKKTNSFSAEFFYMAEKIDDNNIEIWKTKVDRDKNYMIYKLTKGADSIDPFAHLF
ncbi:MAG: hypothetical protein JNN23_06270 [Chryseobacterium gambrini]|nr:hypothetical protein [Chryseobacterium gambrini]